MIRFTAWAWLVVAGIGVGACCKPTTAPEANPELSGSGPASSGSAAVPSGDRPVLDGFEEFKFGMPIAKVKALPALKKRCKTELVSGKYDKEFPGQSFEPQWLACDSTIAERYARMVLRFDNTASLYEVMFKFNIEDPDTKVKVLPEGEVDKFIADLRGLLEPKYGKATDISTRRLSGASFGLVWDGRTDDKPAHATDITVSMERGGFMPTQWVAWTDNTRHDAIKAQIEKERTSSVKTRGL